MEPRFSCVLITRNEANTLPRLMESLKDFTSRGGEVVVLDTGSTDGTADLARSLGCKVTEVGDKFVTVIDAQTAEAINKRFVVDNEADVVREGNRLFDFAAARNYATSLASNDMVCTLDADEAYSTLDIDRLNQLIAEGYQQFEYQFVFAHDPWGRPAVQFVQSKFFDRRNIKWVGIVHEVLQGEGKKLLLGTDTILLEHWQEPGKDHRGNYIVGLALDCLQNPTKDRQSHYLAREMLWTGRPKSAIKEFERHIQMNGWPAERAQSMIFIGDAYGMLGNVDKQKEWYHKAFDVDPFRREALIKLARLYRKLNILSMVIHYAKASLDIPWTDYYANDRGMYEHEPHELLYWAYGWIGDTPRAREHLLKALDYRRDYPEYLDHTKYYFEYPSPKLEGWMSFRELTFLYETAKRMESFVEAGSWKGKSTHAILSSGCPRVWAIDHWKGSMAEPESHAEAKTGAVFETFKKNVEHFKNLTIINADINDAVKDFADKSVDAVFIDAGHTYEEVRNDIRKWKNKARILLCGHDYCDVWPGVIQAVDEELGGPDEIHDTIWVKYVTKPRVSICVPTLGRPEKLHRLLTAIKDNANYDNYEVVVKVDEPIPNNIGVPKMLRKCVESSTGDLVMFLGNDCVPEKNFLQEAVWAMIRAFPALDGLVALNDGHWNGTLATHWLASKKLLPTLGGEFFHSGYYHTMCDNELTERCRLAGKYVYAPKARIFHDHPLLRNSPLDDLYRLAYQADRVQHDQKLYAERAKTFTTHEQ